MWNSFTTGTPQHDFSDLAILFPEHTTVIFYILSPVSIFKSSDIWTGTNSTSLVSCLWALQLSCHVLAHQAFYTIILLCYWTQ